MYFSTILNYIQHDSTIHLALLLNTNKRAQRALGRSPEKKVKGHSGANNRII